MNSERTLYEPSMERDSCGIGFVADLHGRRSHELLLQALQALRRFEHRGAVSADGLSGDGAGVLTHVPQKLLRRELAARGHTIGEFEDLAVAMVFLPTDAEVRARAEAIFEQGLEAESLRLLCWRDVPVGEQALGDLARASRPFIRQALIERPSLLRGSPFERRLMLTRRRIERGFAEAGIEDAVIPSMSHRTIVYKGLMVAGQLDAFYADLSDPDYETAICVFHQRYSTNTFPDWALAQPFRYVAHNGEINTIQGNINWMRVREPDLRSPLWGERISELTPVIKPGSSDSFAFDNVFELLTLSGRDPLHTAMMMVPEAYQHVKLLDTDLSAFFEYHVSLMEPWDGPAALVFSDGRFVAAGLDRNGLRPLRYCVTRGGRVIAASEAGSVAIPESEILERGRLGPGKILAVDTRRGRLLHDVELKREYARRRPYKEWIETHLRRPPEEYVGVAGFADVAPSRSAEARVRLQLAFGYGREEVQRILQPMLYDGREPIGSMGDDTPLAPLSHKPQLLYRYFRQGFAQVTNPPMDSVRERLVMSLWTAVGNRGCVLEERPEAVELAKFGSCVLSTGEFEWLLELDEPAFAHTVLDATFPVAEGPAGLEARLAELEAEAVAAVDAGRGVLVISDAAVNEQRAPVPALLAVSMLHTHLTRVGKRLQGAIVVDTGDAREDHHFACLVGYGASLVYPRLTHESVAALAAEDPRGTGIGIAEAQSNARQAIEKGLRKIMAKMGISTVKSYRGAQIFEAVGLSDEFVEAAFPGTPTRIGGISLEDCAVDVLRFHAEAFGENATLKEKGVYRYRRGGEFHSFNPQVFKSLHRAVREQSQEAYREYSRLQVSTQPCSLRDLLVWKTAPRPLALSRVERAEDIARRFCTQAMSHGALSSEVHELLAVAMNRLGGKSNSGEGGEDPGRFRRFTEDQPDRSEAPWHPEAGDSANNVIKQVASGRFGVTPEYLVCADELEIKMAQGSKPGEGGHIPGHKVTAEIARIRRARAGQPLISPPPHHDIYSIEDLAQLIYDLKRINPRARVGVKLVARHGVGTIAAGVAKGYADTIQISGHSGGTGASPLSAIKYAGLPWELGLAEAHQVLIQNDLRERVLLRVDGSMKTGRDVVIAALLGAEEYGFGTAALIASGCVMVRQCHLNTCPVGVATQRPELRARFPGRPEHVLAFMLYIAEEVRQILAEIGVSRFDQIIGRTDLLQQRRDLTLPKTQNIDLSRLLADPDPSGRRRRRRIRGRNDRPESGKPLDQTVWEDLEEAIDKGRLPIERSYDIDNRQRSVGARLSGEIARREGQAGLPEGSVTLHFRGAAGQSFGVFCNRGMRLFLDGEAQDYVGKSMYGGELVIRPPAGVTYKSHENVILGNTVLYGATGGRLFASGLAGERLCVRNSGASAVVEGCGDHGCEYMTGGLVLILGEVGRNFGAGMTGGVAYVYDPADELTPCLTDSGVVARRLPAEDPPELMELLESHLRLTHSERARTILDSWSTERAHMRVVLPVIEDPGPTPTDREQAKIAADATVPGESYGRSYDGEVSESDG